MARIEDLEDVGYRVKYDDAGKVVAIVGSRGEPSPFVLATTNLTGGIGFNGTVVDMAVTPDDTNTAAYPVGTLFISPV